MPSPIPKREDERRRRNKTTPSGVSNAVEKFTVDSAVLDDTSGVPAPAMDPNWHPLAKMAYASAKKSAVRELYEPTDWALLFVICDQLSQQLEPQAVVVQGGLHAGEVVYVQQPMNGAAFGNILKGFTVLMFAEGDRRKLRFEVDRVNAGSGAALATGENVVNLRSKRLS